MPEEKLLRRREVEDLTALSRSAIYAKMKRSEFPHPIRLTGSPGSAGGAVRWRFSDIQNWIAAQAAGTEEN